MKITDGLLKEIYAHGRETYPHECFGFLVGRDEDGGSVRQVVRATNLNTDQKDRFEMDPKEFIRTDKQADDQGYTIIGVYHSHPDWPAIPSQTDILSEVEGYYYVIASIHEGQPLNTTVWQINGDSAPRRFVQLPLEIVDERVWQDD